MVLDVGGVAESVRFGEWLDDIIVVGGRGLGRRCGVES